MNLLFTLTCLGTLMTRCLGSPEEGATQVRSTADKSTGRFINNMNVVPGLNAMSFIFMGIYYLYLCKEMGILDDILGEDFIDEYKEKLGNALSNLRSDIEDYSFYDGMKDPDHDILEEAAQRKRRRNQKKRRKENFAESVINTTASVMAESIPHTSFPSVFEDEILGLYPPGESLPELFGQSGPAPNIGGPNVQFTPSSASNALLKNIIPATLLQDIRGVAQQPSPPPQSLLKPYSSPPAIQDSRPVPSDVGTSQRTQVRQPTPATYRPQVHTWGPVYPGAHSSTNRPPVEPYVSLIQDFQYNPPREQTSNNASNIHFSIEKLQDIYTPNWTLSSTDRPSTTQGSHGNPPRDKKPKPRPQSHFDDYSWFDVDPPVKEISQNTLNKRKSGPSRPRPVKLWTVADEKLKRLTIKRRVRPGQN